MKSNDNPKVMLPEAGRARLRSAYEQVKRMQHGPLRTKVIDDAIQAVKSKFPECFAAG